MDEKQDPIEEGSRGRPRGAINVTSFLLASLFVWLVFEG